MSVDPTPSPGYRPPAAAASWDAPSSHRGEGGEAGHAYLESVLAAYAAIGPRDGLGMREQLITGFLPVVAHIARRYAGRGEPLEDLEQAGAIGLLKAIDRYDPRLGDHFLSFAVPTITGEIRRHFRDTTWAMRVPRRLKELHGAIPAAVTELSGRLHRAPRPSEIAAHLDATTADVVEALHIAHEYRPRSLDTAPLPGTEAYALADSIGEADQGFELFLDSHCLAPHLAALPPRERSIVVMRFYRNMTQTQIAEEIGVSQMHVSRLLSATLRRLRDAVDHSTADGWGGPGSGEAQRRSARGRERPSGRGGRGPEGRW